MRERGCIYRGKIEREEYFRATEQKTQRSENSCAGGSDDKFTPGLARGCSDLFLTGRGI